MTLQGRLPIIALDTRNGEPRRNADGEILVYTDRVRADEEACKALGTSYAIVAGMGDDKWAVFQKKEKYIVVEGE